MENSEAIDFIGKIKEYYPRWQAGQTEIDEWLKRLKFYDFEKAQQALNDFIFETRTRTVEPPAGKIIAILKDRALIKRERSEETIMTTYYIECIEAPERNPNFNVGLQRGVFAADPNNQNDPDYMLKAAETMRSKYENLYDGKWIIVQKPQEEDTGLRGPQARDKAFADILNGPNNKTKRWLTGFLEKKHKKKEGPESLGSILASKIPF